MQYQNGPISAFTYVLVMPDGQFTIRQDTFQGVRDQIRAGHQGSQEIIDLPSLNPVMAYCSIAYEQPDPRRMNKVANGMVWELTARPEREQIDGDRDDIFDAYAHEPLRVVKMRGPVAFMVRGDRSLEEADITGLREAHETAYAKLRARGWI